MHHVSHFTYGWINPALGYGMSFLGSLLGLLCTSRARLFSWPRRAGWLLLAAVSIGGIGIWLAHFLMMLGFTVPGGPVRYDLTLTALSAVAGIVVVAAGLFVAGTGTAASAVGRLVGAGLFAGLGIAAMHYLGMAAVHVPGVLAYQTPLVAASVVIAIVAATAALWFTVVARSPMPITGAALLMAGAVAGMHYVGMAGVPVRATRADLHPSGADPSGFLTGVTLIAATAVLTILYFVLMAPDEHERSVDLGLREMLSRGGAQPGLPTSVEVPAQRPVEPSADQLSNPAAAGGFRRSA
jgi:NO-binding membrane sensor protein with MHYT domain